MESSLIASAREWSVVKHAARGNSLRARSSQVHCWIRVLGAIGLVLISAVLAAAQDENKKVVESDDPTQLSLDQLMKSEIYSASKQWQRVAEAPSSISIVTADQIKKYGYRTLADILRSVRGVYVTNDRNYSYIGIRGFARPGDYNTRVLLLVDGHRLNDNVYDGAYIGTEFPVDVDLIERVEVIRGPSSSLYGGSAFFGVINVVTKTGHDLDGVEVTFEDGSFGTYKGRVSFGESFRNGLDAVISASFYDSAGHSKLFFSEFNNPSTNNGIAVDADRDRYHSVFEKLSFRDFRFQTVYGSREKVVPTASFDTVFNDPRTKTIDTNAFVDLQYGHTFQNKWDLSGRLSYNRYAYNGNYVYDSTEAASQRFIEKDFARAAWWGTELNASKKLFEKHRLTLGLDYRDNIQQDQVNYDTDPYVLNIDDRRQSKVVAFYGQDEFKLRNDIIVSVGIRHDRYSAFGSTTNPRFALIYTPQERTSIKVLYGEAFRPPNFFESYFNSANREGEALNPETIKTGEVVLEQYIGRRFRISTSGYLNNIHGLINQQIDALGQIKYANVGSVQGYGLELEVEGKWFNGFEGRAAYSLQRSTSEETGEVLSNSPMNLAKMNLTAPLGQRRLFASFEGLYSGSRLTLSRTTLPASFVANVSLLGQRIFKRAELSLGIYNLFNTHYSDPGGEELRQSSIPQDQRNWRIKLTYRFGEVR
jgi:outer membrane receptor for ferrienterochelin and colicins